MCVRIMLAVLLLALAALAPVPRASAQTIRVFVDGDPVRFDQPPIIVGSRVMVPLRGVFEKMGATVDWEAATRTVVAVRGTTVVELVIGSRTARVNDRRIVLDVAAMIVNGRTLVPLRFISESLGGTVQWVEATRTVLIFTTGAGPTPPPASPPVASTTGTLVEIRASASLIVLEAPNGVRTRVTLTGSTTITRTNLTTNEGGAVGLRDLKVGDEIEATMSVENTATAIRATFRTVTGRLERVDVDGRRIVLRNGNVYRVAAEVEVVISGRSGRLSELRRGMSVTLRLNPRTELVWGVTARP